MGYTFSYSTPNYPYSGRIAVLRRLGSNPDATEEEEAGTP